MTEPHETAPAMSLAELQALVQETEREAEDISTRLGTMWQLRQKGELPLGEYPTYLYLEDQLRVRLQQLERMQPRLLYAKAEDAMTTGKAHYDRYCALVTEQSLRVCQAWVTFVETCAGLAQLIDEQRSPLELLTRADGQPMFELDGGTTTLQNMLAAFPAGQTGFLAQSVIPFLSAPMREGLAATVQGHVKGREPFSETNVERYLAEYRVKESEPTED